MHTVSDAMLLDVHDRGTGLHAIDRALLLLDAAASEGDRSTLAALPLGVRDARLLAVRRLVLGDRLDAEARCPSCAERLELSLDCRTLIARATPPPERWRVVVDAYDAIVRPLTSLDAAMAAASLEVEDAALVLLRQCVVEVTAAGIPVDVASLPDDVRTAIAESLAVNDPGAEWLLDFTCPACDHRWHAVFDVAEFVWRELSTHSERVLGEVHVLARAYGWREADILALPARRRAAYLALAAG